MGKIKDFLLRKTLEAKMKDVPESEREKLLAMMEANPELFRKISDEVKQKTKKGQSEIAATMVVMRKYQSELQKLLK